MQNLLRSLLIVIALAVAMPSAQAQSAPITWNFGGDLVLYQDAEPTDRTSVDISAGQMKVWTANHAALVDLDLGGSEKQVDVTLQFRNGTSVRVDVGRSAAAGADFVSCAGRDIAIGALQTVLGPTNLHATSVTVSIALPASCPIAAGEHFALQVSNSGSDTVTIGTAALSAITGTIPASSATYDSPPPAYPTPELPALFLTSLGILGIVAMSRFRK